MRSVYKSAGCICLLAVAVFAFGCQKETAEKKSSATPTTAASDPAHDGWWCPEHGVPEGECTRCDASLITGFKEKGDWCEKHDRPDSQCFVCHPENEAKFAERYEAKYGEKPPKPTEN